MEQESILRAENVALLIVLHSLHTALALVPSTTYTLGMGLHTCLKLRTGGSLSDVTQYLDASMAFQQQPQKQLK